MWKYFLAFLVSPMFAILLNAICGLFGVGRLLGVIPPNTSGLNLSALLPLFIVAATISSLVARSPPKPLLVLAVAGNVATLLVGFVFLFLIAFNSSALLIGLPIIAITLLLIPLISGLAVLSRWPMPANEALQMGRMPPYTGR